MEADVAKTLNAWSTTAGSNAPSGATAISTNLDDNLREMQAVVRQLAASNTLAAATTTDLSTVDATFITLTGTAATIAGLGTLTAGMYKWVVMNAAHTLTHNGTSLILPTAANITAASGDVAMFVSLGSGNWRCLSYLRATGKQVLDTAALLSELGAAAAANTISNTDYAQTWQWKLTTASKQALSLTESAASTGANSVLFDIETLAASTAYPINITARGSNILTVKEDGEVFIAAAIDQDIRIGQVPTGPAAVGGGVTGNRAGDIIIAGQGSQDGDGGDIVITAGNSISGTSGSISLSAGLTTTNAGNIGLTGSSVNITAGDRVVFVDSTLTVSGGTNHTPTINTGGGSGAAITGSDACFQVTFGSGDPTSVTVDFGTAYAAAPMVIATGTQSGQIIHVAAVSTTQVQISSSTAFSSGTKVNVLCIEEA
jgi:hypothetical protein